MDTLFISNTENGVRVKTFQVNRKPNAHFSPESSSETPKITLNSELKTA
jgi:hypothetical protein